MNGLKDTYLNDRLKEFYKKQLGRMSAFFVDRHSAALKGERGRGFRNGPSLHMFIAFVKVAIKFSPFTL